MLPNRVAIAGSKAIIGKFDSYYEEMFTTESVYHYSVLKENIDTSKSDYGIRIVNNKNGHVGKFSLMGTDYNVPLITDNGNKGIKILSYLNGNPMMVITGLTLSDGTIEPIENETEYDYSVYYVVNGVEKIPYRQTVTTLKSGLIEKGDVVCGSEVPSSMIEGFTNTMNVAMDEVNDIFSDMSPFDLKFGINGYYAHDGAAASFAGYVSDTRIAYEGVRIDYNVNGYKTESSYRSVMIHELLHTIFGGSIQGVEISGLVLNVKPLKELLEFATDLKGANGCYTISHGYPFNSSTRYDVIGDYICVSVFSVLYAYIHSASCIITYNDGTTAKTTNEMASLLAEKISVNGIKKAEFTDKAKSIGGACFYNANGIFEIVWGKNITSIYDSAFGGTSFVTMEIPYKIKKIGPKSFSNMISLSSITLNESLETIEEDAFNNDKRITDIKIPKNVTTIGDGICSNCSQLERIEVDTNNQSYSDWDGKNGIYNKEHTILVQGCKNTQLSEGIRELGNKCFMGMSGITEIILPSSVESLGNSAFTNTRISTINIGENINRIGDACFYGCVNLTEFTLPSGLTVVSDNLFYNCSSLSKINNNSTTLKSIGYKSFMKAAITSFTINEGVTEIKESAFRLSNLETINLPETLTNIGNGAFYGTKLSQITIPKNVNSIGDEVFYSNLSLSVINVSTENVTYDSRNNANAIIETKTNKLIYGPNSVSSYKIPEGVEIVGTYAFSDLMIQNFDIPSSVKTLEPVSFIENRGNWSGFNVILRSTNKIDFNNSFQIRNNSSSKLYVPSDLVDAYKSDTDWSGAFGTISAIA